MRQRQRDRALPGFAPLALPCLSLLAGCGSDIQSALNPQGPAAASIADIAWVMFAGATVIFLLVIALLSYALWRRPARRARIVPDAFILGGGVVLPVVTLSALLVYAFVIGADLEAEPAEKPLVVEVTAHQWWWEFTYVDADSNERVVTANELHVPAGRPVRLKLKSADVIHTFWVPNLAGKRDMIPGHVNELVIEADRPGIFRGQCNEFCGAQHTLMSLYVISEPPQAFDRWLAHQAEPARQPDTVELQAGRHAFMSQGCALCHRIRGTDAKASTAPDLTHFGSRRSIAAATLENNLGNIEAWIASAQHIKPGSKMPSYKLDGRTLRSIAMYLESLE